MATRKIVSRATVDDGCPFTDLWSLSLKKKKILREQKFLLSASLFETHFVHKSLGKWLLHLSKANLHILHTEKSSFCDLLFNGSSQKPLPYFKF